MQCNRYGLHALCTRGLQGARLACSGGADLQRQPLGAAEHQGVQVRHQHAVANAAASDKNTMKLLSIKRPGIDTIDDANQLMLTRSTERQGTDAQAIRLLNSCSLVSSRC